MKQIYVALSVAIVALCGSFAANAQSTTFYGEASFANFTFTTPVAADVRDSISVPAGGADVVLEWTVDYTSFFPDWIAAATISDNNATYSLSSLMVPGTSHISLPYSAGPGNHDFHLHFDPTLITTRGNADVFIVMRNQAVPTDSTWFYFNIRYFFPTSFHVADDTSYRFTTTAMPLMLNDTIAVPAGAPDAVVKWKVVSTDFPADWLATATITDNNATYGADSLAASGNAMTTLPYATAGNHTFNLSTNFAAGATTGSHYLKVMLTNPAMPVDTNYMTFVVNYVPGPSFAMLHDTIAISTYLSSTNMIDYVLPTPGSTGTNVDWSVVGTDFPADWIIGTGIYDNYIARALDTLTPSGSVQTGASFLTSGTTGFILYTLFNSSTTQGTHYVRLRVINRDEPTDTAYATFVLNYTGPSYRMEQDTVSAATLTSSLVAMTNRVISVAGSSGTMIGWTVESTDFPANWIAASQISDNVLHSLSALTMGTYAYCFFDSTNVASLGLQTDLAMVSSYGTHYLRLKTINYNVPNDEAYATFKLSYLPLGVPVVSMVNEGTTLYPNPATNEINVMYNGVGEVKTAVIYNMIGKAMAAYKVSGNSANMSLNNIPSGIYFVKLADTSGQVVSTQRFTKSQ